MGTGFFAHSVTFAVIGGRYKTASGTKYLVLENGAMIPLSAASVPDSMTTDVACSVDAGAPLLADWIYDGGRCGYYVITWADGSRWTLRAALPVSSGTSLYYELVKLEDRVGNALTFSYGACSNSTYGGFPLLLSINDGSTGTALLTLTHAGGGNGNLTAVSDCYNRSVYYHIGSYATSNVPGPYIQSYQELDEVSQIVTTGTGSPPLRYAYDYDNVGNGEPDNEGVPFLHTIEVPSPTGTGSSTATINYEDDTNYVTSIVDGNGNQVVFDDAGASETQVFYKDPMGTTVYSYTVGFDGSMNETSRTDGTNSTVVVSKDYGDANDPFRASSVTDGNGNEWDYTWDSFGNIQTETTPRSTVTTYTWDYGDFPLGRLTSIQEGSKTATTVSYIEPSGLIDTVNTPEPGTTGGGTVATSYTYSTLGNLTAITTPGNNASATRGGSLGYTTDGMYSQSEAWEQPVKWTNELSKVTHFRYHSRGNKTVQADAYGNESDFSYNIADQMTQISYPATGQTGMGQAHLDYAYLYPGGPLVSEKLYNEANSLVREIDHTYGLEGEHLSSTGSAEPVSHTYDAAYRSTGLTDGRSHTTSYLYNSAGYLSEVRYPGYTSGNADRVQLTSYDDNGNVLQRIDGRGIETDYEYTDDESKLTDIEYPASSGLNVHLAYDSYGRRDSMSDGTGSHAYAYDDLDVLTSDETTYTGLAAKTISYDFYADGSRETMTTPAGDFTCTYDSAGQMTGLSNPYSESSSWSYLDNGWLHDQSLDNGAVTTYTHNELGEITDLVTTVGMTTSSSFTGMVYDTAMNRTTMTATVPAHTAYSGQTDFTYSSKDELTQEDSTRQATTLRTSPMTARGTRRPGREPATPSTPTTRTRAIPGTGTGTRPRTRRWG